MLRRSLFCSNTVLGGRLSLLACTIMFTACSDSAGDRPPLYPVNGKVLVNGKPLPTGTVGFELDEPPRVGNDGTKEAPFRASARITKEGSFSINGYAGAEGMPKGKYKVIVSHVAPTSEKNFIDVAPSTSKVKTKPLVVNRKYSDFKTTDLHTEVFADKPNEPVFDLK